MSEKAKIEKVNPIRVIDNKTGTEYELDFSRESIKFAEARGFRAGDIFEFPVTMIPELWFYAFRKNHKNVARAKTDELLDEMGGLTPAMIERLSQLYSQAGYSHVVSDGDTKNANVTVEM